MIDRMPPPIRPASAILLLAASAAAAAAPEPRFAGTCTGSETVQVGDGPAQSAPFAVAFSADLPRGRICYDKCKIEQTYEIADAVSDPIRFADVNSAGQTRRITYSRAESRLTDDQEMSVGPVRVVRHAV